MTYRRVVDKGRSETLAEMMFFIQRFTLNRAWNGLTDDEFLWEPMPGCWTVRPVEETRTPTPFVVGAWAADFDVDLAAASNPSEGRATEPLTSIAWLFWHIGSMPGRTAQLDFLGGDHTTESGGPRRSRSPPARLALTTAPPVKSRSALRPTAPLAPRARRRQRKVIRRPIHACGKPPLRRESQMTPANRRWRCRPSAVSPKAAPPREQ